MLRQGSSPSRCAQGIGDGASTHAWQEALRKTSDITKTVMALIHLTMDGESVSRVVVDVILLYLMDVRTQATDGETVRRVSADGISLYPRDVRTLVRCCIPISLSSAEGTIVAFALE
jgi:hypothetical protein